MLKGKEILITGPTGFIGANLVKECLQEGAKIYIFTRATSNKWRINDNLQNLKEYRVDLLDYERLEAIITKIKPEIVFHTASYGGYPFQRDSEKIIATNIAGTANLVNACSKSGFGILVNSGSSSEYGLKSRSMRETDLLEPNSIYAAGKASATLFCQAKAKSENLPIVTLRLFSPYGYYEEPTRLIPSVIMACLTGKNPNLSSPESVRDFIFIKDVINAYIKVTEVAGRVKGEIFNIACGRQYSVGEVVSKLIELTGNKVEPKWKSIPNPRVEPAVWVADISKAKNILKWQPQHDLEDGFKKTIGWFEKNIGLYNDKK